ncbi:hypothetical protein AMATHDRAFT_62854 [Amanita thiersii Skay4041]|uniref:Transmembrane protein 188 n=1 Tax=Amanita thiersii Skay4041 TaxID=703135 RepID=A0A2A9NJQ1_9AGAR|nr:hypothetical protein AMATHDRAFT_62854 [Amanita thiersii Skay4041]
MTPLHIATSSFSRSALKPTQRDCSDANHATNVFLFQLLVVIAFLLLEVLFLPPEASLLAIPYKGLLQRLLPDIYSPETEVILHPYIASGLLFVAITTLVLFFASGMYTEKIAYANRYVPHVNRSLRSFNMYLNVRKPPLRSRFKFLSKPLSFFFPRTENERVRPNTNLSSRPPSPSPLSPSRSHSSSSSPARGSAAVPIPTIPPASNPRGELIFSSRVPRSFREGYERYRAAFERKRVEREQMQRRQKWIGWLTRWWDAAMPAAFGSAGNITPMRTLSTASTSTASRGRVPSSRSSTPPTIVSAVRQESMSHLLRSRNNASPSSGLARQSSPPPREREVVL